MLAEGEVEADGLVDREAEDDGLGDSLEDGLTLALGLGESETDDEGDWLADGLTLRLTLELGL